MKKIAHSIKIKVFVKETESEEKIKEKLLSLLPEDIDRKDIKIESEIVHGFDEKKIKILSIKLNKNRYINSFIEYLSKNLIPKAKELILKQAPSRLDKECNFYLRFSKQKYIKENQLWLTDQGNCFHIKINVAAFPRKKEKALTIIRNVFKPKQQG